MKRTVLSTLITLALASLAIPLTAGTVGEGQNADRPAAATPSTKVADGPTDPPGATSIKIGELYVEAPETVRCNCQHQCHSDLFCEILHGPGSRCRAVGRCGCRICFDK